MPLFDFTGLRSHLLRCLRALGIPVSLLLAAFLFLQEDPELVPGFFRLVHSWLIPTSVFVACGFVSGVFSRPVPRVVMTAAMTMLGAFLIHVFILEWDSEEALELGLIAGAWIGFVSAAWGMPGGRWTIPRVLAAMIMCGTGVYALWKLAATSWSEDTTHAYGVACITLPWIWFEREAPRPRGSPEPGWVRGGWWAASILFASTGLYLLLNPISPKTHHLAVLDLGFALVFALRGTFGEKSAERTFTTGGSAALAFALGVHLHQGEPRDPGHWSVAGFYLTGLLAVTLWVLRSRGLAPPGLTDPAVTLPPPT